MELKERAHKLMQQIPAVFLAFKDEDTPVLAKVMASITLCYALSPIDLIPDFIPVLGYLDDVILLPALLALTIRLIPKEVWERNRRASADMWKGGKPKRWYYALPIIAVWLLTLWLIIRTIWF
ncbi:MAG: DUF1232 domain-containing protein [Clostridiales bacterium]|jgi:uncharacterized membrane protein YkvA (DUF1232 family)|nr:DUF1232 domain-containing protein [Clostridiales bacterium]